ncbi:hypothetical protein OR214_02293 [Ralstonia pickettii OR214]|jgi:hypothetical protein|uniref:Uncharacterized protein n=2 Tax=Ralstonia pickettii TaxID=329 RepID=R0E9C2_RALPI|nr:hypothetical protein OR214_02293 [Ralstonia pickettii OR214]
MNTRTFLPPAELTGSARDEYRALRLTESEFLQVANFGRRGGSALQEHSVALGTTGGAGTAAFDAILNKPTRD